MSKSRLAAGTAVASANTNATPPPIEPGGARGITTVPGQMAALLPGFAEAKDALAKAQRDLAKWDGVLPVRRLDPRLIRRSKWANRSEAEFQTPEFAALKGEIENAGGNVQPIKVRRVMFRTSPSDTEQVMFRTSPSDAEQVMFRTSPPDALQEYEIAYGHRRHQACLELGVSVLCLVVDDMEDRELFEVMDRENRSRKDLSPYDQGRMYAQALETGLYPSVRKLAEGLGVDQANATKYLQLARLPREVIEAFPSPFDLAQRWAKPLSDAAEKDRAGLVEKALALKSAEPKLDANTVFAQLVGSESAPVRETKIEVKGRQVAVLVVDKKGRATVNFNAGALNPAKQAGLAKLIREYLSKP